MGGGLEELVLALGCGFFGSGEEGLDLSLRHGLEGAGGFKGLVQDLLVIDAGDEDGDGLGEAVVEGFHGLDGFAVEDEVIAEGLHGEDADSLLDGDGHDLGG